MLHVVQMARIFPDSKTFVDMKLKADAEHVKDQFKALLERTDNAPEEADLKAFVELHFTLENQMEDHEPEDWIPDPKVLSRIADDQYRDFGGKLNLIWKILCRKVSEDVRDNPERYSLIYLPNPVVVPGGRFRVRIFFRSLGSINLVTHAYRFIGNILLGLLLDPPRTSFVRNVLDSQRNSVELCRIHPSIRLNPERRENLLHQPVTAPTLHTDGQRILGRHGGRRVCKVSTK